MGRVKRQPRHIYLSQSIAPAVPFASAVGADLPAKHFRGLGDPIRVLEESPP